MVAGVAPQIAHVIDVIGLNANFDPSDMRSLAPIVSALKLTVELPVELADGPDVDRRHFYDVTGKVVIESLRDSVAGLRSIDLKASGGKRVLILADTANGTALITFDRSRVSASNAHQPLTIMLVASLMIMFVAYCFLRNQLRPILRLAAASDAFGRGEVTDLKIAGATEVRSATQSFLEMRERIESHSRQRTEFLLRIGHDLKTPLSRIRYGLSLMEDSEDLTALQRDVDLLDNMIVEAIDFARNSTKEAYVDVDPEALVQEVVSAARAGGQAIAFRPVGELPMPIIKLRRASMRRAIENLISNAHTYADSCQVSVLSQGEELIFRVEDDGPGIAPEMRAAALQPFARLDDARAVRQGVGLGLGLSISSDIAASHGGKLQLGESPDLKGLMAEIRLPATIREMVGPEGLEPPTKAL